MNNFPDHVFRAYDIRGVAYDELTVEFAYRLGLAYGTKITNRDAPVVTARDVRLSGHALHQALARGIHDAGMDTIDIGMVPTPLAYYAVHTLNAAGCVIVTGSHNPSADNGFKMMQGLESLQGKDILHLRDLMVKTDPEMASTQGHAQQHDIITPYHRFVTDQISLHRPIKVVVDAGNGPAGMIAVPLYRTLGCDVVELFCEPDGHFPNHHPDPTVDENLHDLIEAVQSHQADIGLAFDGDGDRIGMVDEQGNIIRGDMTLLLLARDLLKQHPGATIISEVKCSQHMYDDIRAHGGDALMWRTGHSPIKAKMKETGALLAGEMSGHIFFADQYYGFDDAIYAGARLIQLLVTQRGTLSTLLDDLPDSISTPEIRVDCPDSIKFDIVEEAKRHFSELGYKIIDIDGMRIQFDDGWGLLRASNTQPSLVLRFEAPSEVRLQEMRETVEGWLASRM